MFGGQGGPGPRAPTDPPLQFENISKVQSNVRSPTSDVHEDWAMMMDLNQILECKYRLDLGKILDYI